MAKQKTYSRINWENYPSETTPINETNLNRIDYAVNEVDNRVIELDTEKLDKSDAYGLITSVTLDNASGILRVEYLNGTFQTYQTILNKVAVNFKFDPTTQKITITNEDGSTEQIDLSAFITQYEFEDTTTISFEVSTNGKVQANINKGSISDDMIKGNYLSQIKVAQASAEKAQADAEANALESKSWAVGGTETRGEGEDADNSKYYSQLAQSAQNACGEIKEQAQELLDAAIEKVANAKFSVDWETGILYCESDAYEFTIDVATGWLQMEVKS